MDKNFEQDFHYFLNRIIENKAFSLSRYGDGELSIINGQSMDLSNKFNGEHKYISGQAQDEKSRKRLLSSLTYKHKDYFVGIPCRCCVGDEAYENLKTKYFDSDDNLTWANIFVNSNYQLFLNSMLPLFEKRDIYLCAHQKAKPDFLNIKKHYKIGANSWIDNIGIIDEIKNDAEHTENQIFLFCAGVLSNIAVKELHEHAPNNFYIDLGSVLDYKMGLGKTRRYLKGADTLKKTCIW